MACLMRSASAPLKREPGAKGVADFYGATPAFMLGPGTGVEKESLGPGALFDKLEMGDEALAKLTGLERRLYHSHVPTRKSEASLTKEKLTAAANQAASSAPPAKPAGRRKRGAQPLPEQPRTEASSGSRAGRKALAKSVPLGLHARGVVANDITYAHENSLGVCVTRVAKFPDVPDIMNSSIAMRMEHKDACLADARAWDAKVKAHYARAPSPGGSSQGCAGAILPKQQRMTAGLPSLCRPIPPGDPEGLRTRYGMREDAFFSSESRSHFWWKDITSKQRHEIKQHVRPYDNWTIYRDVGTKNGAGIGKPIVTY